MLEPRKIRQLLALAIILAGISLVVVIAGKFSGAPKSAPVSTPLSGNADIALRKIHFSEMRDGSKKWELVADSAEHDRASGIARLSGVRMQVAGEPATGDILLTAERADYHTETKDLQLTGKVRVTTDSGLEVTMPKATYVNSLSLVRTDTPVRLTDKEMTVSGVGLELNTVSRSVRILRNVEANLKGGSGR